MLRRYTWKSVRKRCQHYRRRRPESTELYRLVYHSRDELEHVWEERFQQQYGVLRDEVLRALDEYLNCGLLEHGAARVYCDSCKQSLLVAFSCKKRGICPSCSTKRAVNFAEHIYDTVLEDVPHRHVVFTIPKRLRPYFRYDRRLASILFRAAWKSISDCLEVGDTTPALVLTLQTAGEALNFNPHLHGMLADGVFALDGSFQPFADIDLATIQQSFENHVLAAFAKQELITDEVMAQVLSQEHTGFSVWLGEPFQDAESELFVARYVERGPLALDKLSTKGNLVVYTTKDGAVHTFEPLEFLALLTSHIPNTYESITRYYGWYSCRSRGERMRHVRRVREQDKTPEPLPEPEQKPNSSWARAIKRIYEVNPLECPRCKAEMRIVAFLHNPREIKNIADSLGIPEYRAPPPLPRPPSIDDFFTDDTYSA